MYVFRRAILFIRGVAHIFKCLLLRRSHGGGCPMHLATAQSLRAALSTIGRVALKHDHVHDVIRGGRRMFWSAPPFPAKVSAPRRSRMHRWLTPRIAQV